MGEKWEGRNPHTKKPLFAKHRKEYLYIGLGSLHSLGTWTSWMKGFKRVIKRKYFLNTSKELLLQKIEWEGVQNQLPMSKINYLDVHSGANKKE